MTPRIDRLVLVSSLLVMLSGCPAGGCSSPVPEVPPTPIPPLAPYGEFIGKPETRWLDDDDEGLMELLKDFSYRDPRGKIWTAKQGLKLNGASIPSPFWSIIGHPYSKTFRNASVIHDHYCVHRNEAICEDVHEMFYYACLCGGTSKPKAAAMYFAVFHLGGPHWCRNPPVKSGVDDSVSRVDEKQRKILKKNRRTYRDQMHAGEDPSQDLFREERADLDELKIQAVLREVERMAAAEDLSLEQIRGLDPEAVLGRAIQNLTDPK